MLFFEKYLFSHSTMHYVINCPRKPFSFFSSHIYTFLLFYVILSYMILTIATRLLSLLIIVTYFYLYMFSQCIGIFFQHNQCRHATRTLESGNIGCPHSSYICHLLLSFFLAVSLFYKFPNNLFGVILNLFLNILNIYCQTLIS